MPKLYTFLAACLIGIGAQVSAQNLSSLSASWIEVRLISNEQLEFTIYRQYANLQEQPANEAPLEELIWQASTNQFTDGRQFSLPLLDTYEVEQNFYYPNCEPWIGAQPCALLKVARYRLTASVPAGADTMRLRYLQALNNLQAVSNLELPHSSLQTACFTDFVFYRNQSANLHTPRLVLSESWHRHFPLFWPQVTPRDAAFISSYIPMQHSTSTPRGSRVDLLYTTTSMRTPQLQMVSDYLSPLEPNQLSMFARPMTPFQIGIRNISIAEPQRLVVPVRLWNKMSLTDSNLTYVLLIGHTFNPIASSLNELETNASLAWVQVSDIHGRVLYRGNNPSELLREQNGLLIVTEHFKNGTYRSRKIFNKHQP